jgi:hypothetical protein
VVPLGIGFEEEVIQLELASFDGQDHLRVGLEILQELRFLGRCLPGGEVVVDDEA